MTTKTEVRGSLAIYKDSALFRPNRQQNQQRAEAVTHGGILAGAHEKASTFSPGLRSGQPWLDRG